MRILYAITLGEIGGAQEHVRIEADGALAAGHDVGLVTTPSSNLAQALGEVGVTVFDWRHVVRNPHPVEDWRARRELASAVAAFAPDVLHLQSSKAGVLGRGLLRRPEGVTVFTCHHAPFGPRRRWTHRAVARPIEQVMLRRLDGIISDGARDMPLLRKLAPHVPIRLIRNGISAAGEPVGAAPNHVVLWVARLQDPKDPMLAVAAFERVVEELPDARLLICGTGRLQPTLRRRVAASAARGNIEVLGRVPDLRPYQEQASVFLLATAVEGGVTMATLEAMAQGLVPVVSDAGDAFLLEHAGCGVVVQPGSTRALADSLIELLRNPGRISAMRSNALRFSREDWTSDDMVAATLAFYEELLDR